MGAVNPTISGETETQVRLPASPGSPTPCDLEPIVAFAGPQFSCELKSLIQILCDLPCQLLQPL